MIIAEDKSRELQQVLYKKTGTRSLLDVDKEEVCIDRVISWVILL